MGCTLRIRHDQGTLRVTFEKSSLTNQELYERITEELIKNQVISATIPPKLALYSDPKYQQLIPSEGSTKDIPNGTFVFVKTEETNDLVKDQVDPVDHYLSTLDGRLKRPLDPRVCKHGPHGMCEHCRPLEPWDPQQQGDAKHLSLQCWLRKNKLERAIDMVPEYSVHRRHQRYCRRDHLPYPKGLCTKCQPPAISLQRQPFRVTDHIEFSGGLQQSIDQFLDGWRRTGWQQFAWLIGYYAPYTDNVPLGVKAVVLALFKPPQDSAVDGFQLKGNWKADLYTLNSLLRNIYGLQVVGMMYTDLHHFSTTSPSISNGGNVQYRRRPDTFFLTGSELIVMADLQNDYPYNFPGKHNDEEIGPSRWVTAIVTGNQEQQIDIFCYQCSLQGQALRSANLVSASTDPSVLMMCPDSDYAKGEELKPEEVFIPTVIYGRDNEYGVKVQHCDDRHVPVDYLLVNLSHGFTTVSSSSTTDEFKKTIPDRLILEGNSLEGSIRELTKWRNSLGAETFQESIVRALNNDPTMTLSELKKLAFDNYIVVEEGDDRLSSSSSLGSSHHHNDDHGWSCTHCTFINHDENATDCSMCGLPR